MDPVALTLFNLYYNPDSPAAFSGINKLYYEARKEIPEISVSQVDQWLRRQKPYRTHRFKRSKFPRVPVTAFHVDAIWQVDLMQLLDWANDNAIDGEPTKFILIAIDVLSRYAMVEPMASKTSKDTRDAFLRIFHRTGRYPRQLESDQGREFMGNEMNGMIQDLRIIQRFRPPKYKVAIAERFIQTLRNKIQKHIAATRSNRFIEALQELVDGYNHSVHRMLKMRPVDVTPMTSHIAFQNLYGKTLDEGITEAPKFGIGDVVNKFIVKHNLTKGSDPNFDTENVYEIAAVDDRRPPRITYKIRDYYTKEPIAWSFYAEELIKLPQEVVATLPGERPDQPKQKKIKRGPGVSRLSKQK